MTGFEFRQLRESKGLSRSEVARLLEVSDTTLRKLEAKTGPVRPGIVADFLAYIERKKP